MNSSASLIQRCIQHWFPLSENSLLRNAAFATGFSLIGNLLLARLIGVAGIAWSTTLTVVFSFYYLRHSLESVFIYLPGTLEIPDANTRN